MIYTDILQFKIHIDILFVYGTYTRASYSIAFYKLNLIANRQYILL